MWLHHFDGMHVTCRLLHLMQEAGIAICRRYFVAAHVRPYPDKSKNI